MSPLEMIAEKDPSGKKLPKNDATVKMFFLTYYFLVSFKIRLESEKEILKTIEHFYFETIRSNPVSDTIDSLEARILNFILLVVGTKELNISYDFIFHFI